MSNEHLESPKSWWRFGHVWLVVMGPVVVIIAGFITLYLAMSSPNEIVNDESYSRSIEVNRQRGIEASKGADAPAMQARNHAATGAVPVPKN